MKLDCHYRLKNFEIIEGRLKNAKYENKGE